MKKFRLFLSILTFAIVGFTALLFSHETDAQCDDCQYFGKDKGCISLDVKIEDKKISADLSVGSRIKCVSGSGSCNSTSCS